MSPCAGCGKKRDLNRVILRRNDPARKYMPPKIVYHTARPRFSTPIIKK